MSAEDVIKKLRGFDLNLSGAEVQELLDFIDAQHAKIIDNASRDACLREAVIEAVDRLKTLNADVFSLWDWTSGNEGCPDRYGNGEENRAVIKRCLGALTR